MKLHSVLSVSPFARRRSGLLLLTGVLLLAQGCTSKEADASGVKSTVTIVRETKPEFPEKAIARYRELQQRCIEGRSAVAEAQGWAYDPKTDAITDADILALDTQKTEEYFDGAKYAVIVTGTQFDGTHMDATQQEGSCKLASIPFKSVKIDDGDCHSMHVEYDLPESTGRRTEFKGLCDRPSVPIIDQSGETVAVAGTSQQCKWNKPAPSQVHVALCTLLPNPVHAGTGRELVAIHKFPEAMRALDQPAPGTVALTFQSLVTVEQATHIDIGGAIPAAKFEFPADSAAFPLTQVN